jgi:hypothetical protein
MLVRAQDTLYIAVYVYGLIVFSLTRHLPPLDVGRFNRWFCAVTVVEYSQVLTRCWMMTVVFYVGVVLLCALFAVHYAGVNAGAFLHNGFPTTLSCVSYFKYYAKAVRRGQYLIVSVAGWEIEFLSTFGTSWQYLKNVRRFRYSLV